MWEVLAIAVKAAMYAGSLTAAGTVVFSHALRSGLAEQQRFIASVAGVAALLGAVASIAQILVTVTVLAGGRISGMTDWGLINLILETREGASLALRLTGLIGIVFIAFGGNLARAPAAIAALLVWLSFAMTGHVSNDIVAARAVVVVHLACVSYWIGGLLPLLRLCAVQETHQLTAVLQRFGDIAVYVVGALVVAGALLAWRLLDAPADLVNSIYGRNLSMKLFGVGVLLAFAGWNRLRLVPALTAGNPLARARLRFSISMEIILAVLIMLTTAALTTLSGPTGH